MTEKQKTELKAIVLLLRFRTKQPTVKSFTYASYKVIAGVLNLTWHEVQHICRKALQPTKVITPEKRVRMLEKLHIDYLINQRTLEQMSGLTMKERAIRFHRLFTDKRIAVTSLRRLYHTHGIKRKKVRQEKPMAGTLRADFRKNCQELL